MKLEKEKEGKEIEGMSCFISSEFDIKGVIGGGEHETRIKIYRVCFRN
jgi:hypothetical protein